MDSVLLVNGSLRELTVPMAWGMGGCVMLVLLLPFFLQALSFGCKRRKDFPQEWASSGSRSHCPRRHWQRHKSSWVGIFVSVILVTAESLRERNSRIVAVLLALSCSFAVIAASPALSQRIFFYFECNDRSVQWRPNRSMEESGCHDSG